MTTQRFFPPAKVSSPVQFATSGGALITWDPTAAAYVDVTSPQHASLLEAKGWPKLAMRIGPTSERPSASGAYGITPGGPFYDTTLDKVIFWDGAIYRDVAGTAV
jgi:hypothetical protein